MALSDSYYRLHVNITYTNTGNANSAASAIDSALMSLGRSETCSVAGTVVELIITQIPTEDDAVNMRNSIKSAWSGVSRTGGKVALTRSDDV